MKDIFLEPYTYFTGDNSQTKKAFLAGEVRNPSFLYRISKKDIQNKIEVNRQNQESLARFVPRNVREETIKEMYQILLQDQYHKLQMIFATSRQDDVMFDTYARHVYGELDLQICAFSLQDVYMSIYPCTQWTKQVQRQLQSIFDQAQDHLAAIEGDIIPFDQVKYHHQPSAEDQEYVTAYEIYEYFTWYLHSLQISSWEIRIDHFGTKKNVNASQMEKIVWIPCDEVLTMRPRTRLDMKALAVHEIGVHVVRREHGEQQPITLFGIGLPRYLGSEEGLATVWAQQIHGSEAQGYINWEQYLAMAYAQGLLTGEAHDFRDTFTFFTYLFTLQQPEQSLEWIYEKSWKNTWRLFRGTTGQSTGIIFPKDKVYREGNIRVWQAVTQQDMCLTDQWMYQGKIDIFNPQQYSWLSHM